MSDYGGIQSKKTQVSDIFTARLAPGRAEVKNKSADEINVIKMKYVEDIRSLFEEEDIDITINQKDKLIGNQNISIVYIIFHRHIELQVVTYEEYKLLEDYHPHYEEDRVKKKTAGTLNFSGVLTIVVHIRLLLAHVYSRSYLHNSKP